MKSIRAHAVVATAAALLAGAAVTAIPAHGTELPDRPAGSVKDLTGGSFESPPVSVGQPWFLFNAGDTFDGWQVTSGSVNLVDGRWDAADGAQSVDLNGDQPGTISQTFPTVPGQLYRLTYSLAGNPEGDWGVKKGRVLVDGAFMQAFSFDTTGRTPSSMGWTPKALTFVAARNNTTITFQSDTPGSYGPALDNVKVQGCAGTCGT
jgi:choice-of-anchor C domain-containing protein